MKVRLAHEGDVEAIRAMEIEAFGFTWEADVFAKELQRADCLFTVAEVAGEATPVGMASLNWILDECHLMSIAVRPSSQGQGIARHLLGLNLAFIQDLDLQWMTLEVKWDNPPALALYRHFGFTTVGKRKKYYRDGQDARIMWTGRLTEERYLGSLDAYRPEARALAQEWKVSRP